MTGKIWQITRVVGVLAIGLGMMDAAHATYSSNQGTNCGGGGTTNSNCDTWTFNNTTTNKQGGITATATGWANTVRFGQRPAGECLHHPERQQWLGGQEQ